MQNLIQMLYYRGINTEELEPLLHLKPEELPEINDEFLEKMTIRLPESAIYFTQDFNKDIIKEMKKNTIVISFKPLDHKNIKNLFDVQFFNFEELLLNITNNKFVPPHQIVADKQAVLEHLRCTITQLPKIKREDPMAKYIAAKPGDIVRIIRTSPQAGQYVVYRVVI